MKVVLALLLILLLLLVALPTPMGHMADCPACTNAKGHFWLGLCVGMLVIAALIVALSSSRLRLAAQAYRRLLLALSLFRPPRFA